MQPKRYNFVLASSSPRRQELLRYLLSEFKIIAPDTDETPLPGEKPPLFAKRAAYEKALWVRQHLGPEPSVVIAADTIIALDGTIIGKPRNSADAANILQKLSHRAHDVLTGLAVLVCQDGRITKKFRQCVRTRVFFKELGTDEIAAYIATGEPLDKAGAYAIQGQASYMIRRISGSPTNVIGLPLAELKDTLTAIISSKD